MIESLIMRDKHHICLENMYLAAPINRIYLPKIEVLEAEAKIEIQLSENYFHTAGAVHGSVYFKMLDDAAYFAACMFTNRKTIVFRSSELTAKTSSELFQTPGSTLIKAG